MTLLCGWKPDSVASASMAVNVPLAVVTVSSVTSPASAPVITGASLVPVIVIVTVCGTEAAFAAPLLSVATTS